MDIMKSTHIFQTKGIYQACDNDRKFYEEVIKALGKYLIFDWGDSCKEDKMLNDYSIKNGLGRTVAKYKTSQGDIFIIGESNLPVTTIMFSYEY